MKIRFGLKQIAAVTFLAILMGITTGCGSDQSNDPLKPSGVRVTGSSLSYDTTGLTISGTITTKYTLDGTAKLERIAPTISGCSIQSYNIGSNNSIQYSDNNERQDGVSIIFSAPCSIETVTITATEVTDENISWPISATASVQVPAGGGSGVISPITSITADLTTHNITLNSEQREVVLQVRDSNFVPISSGTVSVRYPAVLNAGIMNPIQEVNVVDGVAKFVYTAPSDISTLDGTIYTFGFFDTLNPLVNANVNFTFTPDPTQVIQTEYKITSSVDDANVTMDLNRTTVLSFFLKDKEGKTIADADISSMTVKLLNTNLADLIDSDGSIHDTNITKYVNNVTISLKTFNKSGLLPVEVTFNFTDVNGDSQTLSRIISVVILSGPPTAFSMSYAGTGQDENTAKFIEHIVISAVDEYGNKVNRGSTISAGVITGYARDTASVVGNQYAVSLTPIIDFAPVGSATISNASGSAQMISPTLTTTTIDLNNDKLATFRSDLYDYPFHASGKWDMVSHAGDTVDLLDEYSLADEINMGYVIGHNFRQETCSQTGAKATAYVSSGDGTYKLDSFGNAVIDVYYDYYLVAKTVAIYSNLVTFVNGGIGDVRGGETMVHTLRGHGLEFVGNPTFAVPKNSGTVTVGFTGIHVVDTPIFLRNSRFSYRLKFTKVTPDFATLVESFDLPVGANGFSRMYNCDYGGATFMEIDVASSAEDGSVTFELINVINSEF